MADFLIVPLKQGKKEGSGGNMGKIQTSFERHLSSSLLCTQMLIQDMRAKCAIAVWGLCWCNLLGCVEKTLKLLGFHQLESGGHTRRK